MTEIAFHFNAPTQLSYACRLLRKAVAANGTVAVVAEPPFLAKLDEALWTFSPHDFVPHERVHSGLSGAPETPVWLCESPQDGAGRQVLLNFLPQVPAGFEAFERVIEVVTLDESEKVSARARWKHYTERGYPITRHDLKLRPET
jgi:DNA polymerase III subunit chi